MNSEPAQQNFSIDNPLTLREVGIHLGNVNKSIEANAQIEKAHHAENLASNTLIMKKLDEQQLAYLTRAEFEDHKKDINGKLAEKAGKWVEKPLIAVGSVIGLAVVGALVSLVIIQN